MKQEIINNIDLYLQQNAGKSLSQIVETIKENLKTNRYNNDFEYGNVRVFYNENPNYGNASGRGLGVGFIVAFKEKNTFRREIKLNN